MTNNICCIVPSHTKNNNERLRNSFIDSRQTHCQFKTKERDLIEYNGEYFCLLHLPFEIKSEWNLHTKANEALRILINENHTNFNYICLEAPKISLQGYRIFSFIGANLWSLDIHDSVAEQINFSYCKIQGVNNFRNNTIKYLFLKNSDISSYLNFDNNKIELFYCNENRFDSAQGHIRLDHNNYGIIFRDNNIKTLRLTNNHFFLVVEFLHLTTEVFELRKNIFYSCPILLKNDFKEIQPPVLPQIEDYDLSQMQPNDRNWQDQYRKFREIYNLAKMRDMYTEQSEYFTLMQRCLRKISTKPFFLTAASYTYEKVSDFGQSVSLPIKWIIALYTLSFFLFLGIGINSKNSAYLTITQLQPYSLLFSIEPRKALDEMCKPSTRLVEKNIFPFKTPLLLMQEDSVKECNTLLDYNYGWLLAIWSILESTIYIILLTCLGLALRWNFRKA
jgi:hypothetical protein